MQRYLPVAALAVAALLVAVVVATSGTDKPRAGGARAVARAPGAAPKQPKRESASGAVNGAVHPTQPTAKVSGPHDESVPILMYHVTKAAPAGTPYPELWVSPQDFKGQMNWLADNGYTGITMKRLFEYWDDGYALPGKPVVISFDDGYPSHDKVARPVLAKHGWPGVLFVELNNVGSPDTGFTASMVRDLIAAGWEIDSHTVTHPDLTTIGPERLKFELTASRKRIKREYGVPADFFCYPAGRYNATVVAAVKRAGYRGATTTVQGAGEPGRPFELKRVRIDGADGVSGFAAKMRQTGR